MKINKPLAMIIAGKVFLLFVCSSDYIVKFFIPFVEQFLHHGGNPWQHFYGRGLPVEFPYNPIMLYLLSFFTAPTYWLGVSSFLIKNFLIKLPILLADLGIFAILQSFFPGRRRALLLFVAAAPIILYSSYIHSQLDLIPTFMLLYAIYLLRKELFLHSALMLGIAIGTKFHVAAALPLLLIFILKNYSLKKAVNFGLVVVGCYTVIIAPFILSEGFQHMVLRHPKQLMVFDVCVPIGPLMIFVPIFILCLFYGRFFAYKKINFDLLDAFLGMTFASFVFCLIPAPAWYVWMFPFVAMMFLKHYQENNYFLYVYAALNLAYLLFFIFFYTEPGVHDILFLGHPYGLKFMQLKLINMAFTLLQSVLFLVIYFMYKAGVRSNAIYKRRENLVIGVGGDSGTGKSTLMKNIMGILGSKVTMLEGDGDHRWERGNQHWQEFTHLNPKANFLHRQADHLLLLKAGRTAWRSDYNHHTGTFDPALPVKPNEFIMLGGLHPFYLPVMRKVIDVKIYLDPQEQLKQHWKIVRDMHERGHSKERILQQISKRSEDLKKYIRPQRDFADLIIHFFTLDEFEIGDATVQPTLQLKIVLDSSLKIEPLIQALLDQHIDAEWSYADDLKTQELVLHEPIKRTIIADHLAKAVLANVDELLPVQPGWRDGYDGFIQLIVALVISEKMKEHDMPA